MCRANPGAYPIIQFNIIYIMRTKVEAARLCGFDQNSVNHPGILLWPIQRSFLLRMKLTHVILHKIKIYHHEQ